MYQVTSLGSPNCVHSKLYESFNRQRARSSSDSGPVNGPPNCGRPPVTVRFEASK
jgi:hypothetical protein